MKNINLCNTVEAHLSFKMPQGGLKVKKNFNVVPKPKKTQKKKEGVKKGRKLT